MFDCIKVPDVLISAIPKYLLSLDISASIAVFDKYVLNNSFPDGLYVKIIVLWLPPDIVTQTYPFLFTFTFCICPSTSACHNKLASDITYKFCPLFCATTKNLLLDAYIASLTDISC